MNAQTPFVPSVAIQDKVMKQTPVHGTRVVFNLLGHSFALIGFVRHYTHSRTGKLYVFFVAEEGKGNRMAGDYAAREVGNWTALK